MIKSLTYSVTFPTNGISLTGSYDFQPGLTAITGGNGSGKSFGSIEMIRYMLFGKRALRGPASDYKTLTATMVVEILGVDYTIERTPKGESLTHSDGTILAVGADAVNVRLSQLLNMSLDVFDIVCAAVQKESDRLSKLTPVARKRLIDETVGLTANETVEKDCKLESKALVREADALRSALVVPIEPVMPDGYRPSDVIGIELAILKALLDKIRKLHNTINACGPEPVSPDTPELDLVALERHETKRLATQVDITLAMRQLAALPEVRYTAEELELSEQLNSVKAKRLTRGEAPQFTLAEIESWESYYEREAVANQLGDLLVECPSCSHEFQPGHTMPCTAPNSAVHPSKADLRAARAAHDRWALPVEDNLPLDVVIIELTANQIAEGRMALSREEEHAGLLATTWLVVGEDRSAQLQAARQLKLQWSVYASSHADWTARSSVAFAAEAELKLLPSVSDHEITELDQAFVAARIYETQLEAWMNTAEAYRVALEDIEDRVRRSEDYKLGAKRLEETRQKFKSHLAPTLSRIASSLINDMTGGVLISVIIDGDMNITVNGQDIATLSGAGSTVANLAVRLALGQVLVKGVLPVFIADEADSDMEEARAEYTMECLANLKEKLRQIIVITHKSVKYTDQVISLQSNDLIID